jgi:hypothetical protein
MCHDGSSGSASATRRSPEALYCSKYDIPQLSLLFSIHHPGVIL